jgi:hypothetical protein
VPYIDFCELFLVVGDRIRFKNLLRGTVDGTVVFGERQLKCGLYLWMLPKFEIIRNNQFADRFNDYLALCRFFNGKRI